MRRLDLAIADYDAALKLSPQLASALYGRGEAKRIKGDAAGADADVLAAKHIDPGISGDFARFGARDF
jgi:tetratricopeptide (TPR) repeat protein